MATTYATLKTEVATKLSRSDLTSAIPDLISEGLQRCNLDLAAKGGISAQETSTTDVTVAAQEYITLPTGFRRFTYVRVGDNSDVMESSTFDRLIDVWGSATGQPEEYAVVGSRIYMRPIPDAVYTLTFGYMKDFVALSADGDTNILITGGANILLFASLVAAEALIQDDPRIPIWMANYKESLGLLLSAERTIRRTGKPAGLRMEPALTQISTSNIING